MLLAFGVQCIFITVIDITVTWPCYFFKYEQLFSITINDYLGLSWEEAVDRCPTGVVAACHNSLGSVTISGDVEPLQELVRQLKEEGVTVKEVSTNGVAFHSHHMATVAPSLKAKLSQVSVYGQLATCIFYMLPHVVRFNFG